MDMFYNSEVVDILMRRDGMSESDAKDYYMEVLSEMDDALSVGDFTLALEIFESDLGLEPDYII